MKTIKDYKELYLCNPLFAQGKKMGLSDGEIMVLMHNDREELYKQYLSELMNSKGPIFVAGDQLR